MWRPIGLPFSALFLVSHPYCGYSRLSELRLACNVPFSALFGWYVIFTEPLANQRPEGGGPFLNMGVKRNISFFCVAFASHPYWRRSRLPTQGLACRVPLLRCDWLNRCFYWTARQSELERSRALPEYGWETKKKQLVFWEVLVFTSVCGEQNAAGLNEPLLLILPEPRCWP